MRKNSEFFSSIFVSVQQVLQDSGLDRNQIDQVVLVGGSTRIPKIQVYI